ncbi:MAG TPA: hypothetical protein VMW35_13265 [Myxococcota bacterium]|jgi:hypothetical protein|nr:hypothetical protein [Myxococcota bacterium]
MSRHALAIEWELHRSPRRGFGLIGVAVLLAAVPGIWACSFFPYILARTSWEGDTRRAQDEFLVCRGVSIEALVGARWLFDQLYLLAFLALVVVSTAAWRTLLPDHGDAEAPSASIVTVLLMLYAVVAAFVAWTRPRGDRSPPWIVVPYMCVTLLLSWPHPPWNCVAALPFASSLVFITLVATTFAFRGLVRMDRGAPPRTVLREGEPLARLTSTPVPAGPIRLLVACALVRVFRSSTAALFAVMVLPLFAVMGLLFVTVGVPGPTTLLVLPACFLAWFGAYARFPFDVDGERLGVWSAPASSALEFLLSRPLRRSDAYLASCIVAAVSIGVLVSVGTAMAWTLAHAKGEAIHPGAAASVAAALFAGGYLGSLVGVKWIASGRGEGLGPTFRGIGAASIGILLVSSAVIPVVGAAALPALTPSWLAGLPARVVALALAFVGAHAWAYSTFRRMEV